MFYDFPSGKVFQVLFYCKKVARRPVETAPYRAIETATWRISLRQRAQFHKGASWDRFPHNVYNELKIDVLTHSTITPVTKGNYFILSAVSTLARSHWFSGTALHSY